MRSAIVSLLALLAPATAFAQRDAPPIPLRQVIADERCNAAGLPAQAANALAASHAVLHDGDDCVIAFFRDLEKPATPLEVLSSRTPAHRWAYARIAVEDNDRNAVASVLLEGELILVNLGYADDYAIPIVDSNLNRVATIHGAFVRSWPNGLLEYSPRADSFGPAAVRIGVFDPATATDRRIYPIGPCADSCGTESRVLAPFYFDWRTNVLAVAVERTDDNTRASLMVTCDGLATIKSIQCRETPLGDWQRARPDLNLSQLIVFAASQPRFR